MCKAIILKIGYFRLVFFLNLLSAIPLLFYALIFTPIPEISLKMIFLTAVIGFFLTVIGSTIFSKGLEKGYVSILSPVGSSWGIVTVLLAITFLNEMLTIRQGIAVILLFLGIIFASLRWSNLKMSSRNMLVLGSKEAIIAMVFWGISMFLLKFVNNELGPVWSLVFVRYFAALFLILYGKIIHERLPLSSKPLWLLVLIASILDLTAFIGFNYGISTEFVSIVTPIATSAPAVTIILAFLFLGERLERNQYFGIGIILMGLITISIP